MPELVNPPASHGKDGLLYMNAKRGDPLVQVALVSEWSLDLATDTVETTSLGDKNKTYIQGLKDVKGTLSGFFNRADDVLFDASDSPTGIDMLIYPTSLSPMFFTGPAWLNASIKGGVSSGVTIDGNFVANGAWTRGGGTMRAAGVGGGALGARLH